MNNEKNKQRKWVREEVVILVTEYFKNKNLSVEEIKCSYYSKFLRAREEFLTGRKVPDIFRNYAGICMQSARIQSLDPDATLNGMQGTKLQKEVVKEFLLNPNAMYLEAEEIYKSIKSKFFILTLLAMIYL